MRERVLTAIIVTWAATAVCLGALNYQHAPMDERLPFVRGYQTMPVLEEAPQASVLPDLTDDELKCYRWIAAGVKEGVLIAVDKAEGSEARNLLYIDADGDGDLKNDKPVTAYRAQSSHAYFGPIEVKIAGRAYHLNFMFCDHAPFSLSARSAGYYKGTVTVNGRSMECVLVDGNANGTFNDAGMDMRDRDAIYLGAEDKLTRYAMGRYIDLNGRMYEVAVKSGGEVSLAPAINVTYGTVRTDETVTSLGVGGDNGVYDLTPSEGVAKLPAGRYRVNAWEMTVKKGLLSTWKLTGSNAAEGAEFAITGDAETKLALESKLVAVVTATKSGEGYSFNHVLTGKMGERVTLMKNGKRPDPPKLRIRSADGKFDQSYAFKYG